MHRSFDRRRFLQTCSIASAAAVTGLSANNSLAVEPIVRNGAAKFKFSLAAYSYRNLLQGKTAELTVADFIDDCAKMQLEGTELTSYYFPNPVTPEYLRQLKQQCFRLGLDVSGTAVGNDFGHPPGEKRDEQIANLKRWIDNSEILGAPVIRVFAGHTQQGTTAEQSHKLMVEGLEECCEYAGQHG
ncbi:MAG: TIM barrel protein, partial [Planctomycetota bacterium]